MFTNSGCAIVNETGLSVALTWEGAGGSMVLVAPRAQVPIPCTTPALFSGKVTVVVDPVSVLLVPRRGDSSTAVGQAAVTMFPGETSATVPSLDISIDRQQQQRFRITTMSGRDAGAAAGALLSPPPPPPPPCIVLSTQLQWSIVALGIAFALLVVCILCAVYIAFLKKNPPS